MATLLHVSTDPAAAKRMLAQLPGEDEVAAILAPGEARCPGPTVQDLLHRDGEKPAAVYESESYRFMGDRDVPYDRYLSATYADAELELMWPKTWQWACRLEHIPNPGDYKVYEVGPYSFVIVRVSKDTIKAFYNACLHRGTKLRRSDGFANDLRCPYHGWTWNLDGSLKRIPCAWDFPHVNPREYALPEARVDTWGGFVFINMDKNAKPLQNYLEVIPEHFALWQMERNYVHLHVEMELPGNWKTALEAFMEGYHIMETHPQLMSTASDANMQYDIFGENVSRFLSAFGSQSPYMEVPVSEEQLKQGQLMTDKSQLTPVDLRSLDARETARRVFARQVRNSLQRTLGTDLSHLCDSALIDSAQYFLFPNMMLFTGMLFPMVYRFRPVERNPEKCLLEIVILRRARDNEDLPEPAAPFRVPSNASLTIVPNMDPALGAVFDQDVSNIRAQQEGMRASKKRGQTLGNYQEIRVRQFHQTLHGYVGVVTP